jgi:hypothetical protein
VNSATLRLYKHGNYSGYTKSSTYTVHALTTDWAEASTNWKTPWSSEGINGTSDNCGFIVADLNGDDGSSETLDQESYFYSREASDQANRAQIVVDYDITEIVTEVPGRNTLKIKDLTVSGKKVMFISPSDQTLSLSLYSACGRLVLNKTDLAVKGGRNSCNLSTVLSKGVYFFKFYDVTRSGMYKFVMLTP